MPTFTTYAEKIARALHKNRAFDRASGLPMPRPGAAAALVNAGLLAKATRKPKGGSQTTVYWLTPLGREFVAALAGPRCRHCGCTEMNACPGGCAWVKRNVCSNPKCVAAETRRMRKS